MEIPSGLVAFAVIIGIAYWVNSRGEEKRRQQEDAAANAKAMKVAEAKQNRLANARNKARDTISSRAAEFKVKYPRDQMNWILDRAEAKSGEKGLADIAHVFKTASGDTIQKLIMKIEKDHLMYVVDLRLEQESVESERQWQVLLDEFKRLNPAQQKSHLTYIKKHHAGELTNEQLHILELISLGEANTPKSKDIEVGGVKLFTMKEK